MKKNNFRKLLIASSFLLLGVIKSNAQAPSGTWIPVDTVNNVIVFYQIESCQGTDHMFLQIKNNNSSSVSVNWNFWGATAGKTLSLAANETQIGSCGISSSPLLDEEIPTGKTLADLVANITISTN